MHQQIFDWYTHVTIPTVYAVRARKICLIWKSLWCWIWLAVCFQLPFGTETRRIIFSPSDICLNCGGGEWFYLTISTFEAQLVLVQPASLLYLKMCRLSLYHHQSVLVFVVFFTADTINLRKNSLKNIRTQRILRADTPYILRWSFAAWIIELRLRHRPRNRKDPKSIRNVANETQSTWSLNLRNWKTSGRSLAVTMDTKTRNFSFIDSTS